MKKKWLCEAIQIDNPQCRFDESNQHISNGKLTNITFQICTILSVKLQHDCLICFYCFIQGLSKEEIHSYAASIRHNGELVSSLNSLFEGYLEAEVCTYKQHHEKTGFLPI